MILSWWRCAIKRHVTWCSLAREREKDRKKKKLQSQHCIFVANSSSSISIDDIKLFNFHKWLLFTWQFDLLIYWFKRLHLRSIKLSRVWEREKKLLISEFIIIMSRIECRAAAVLYAISWIACCFWFSCNSALFC